MLGERDSPVPTHYASGIVSFLILCEAVMCPHHSAAARIICITAVTFQGSEQGDAAQHSNKNTFLFVPDTEAGAPPPPRTACRQHTGTNSPQPSSQPGHFLSSIIFRRR